MDAIEMRRFPRRFAASLPVLVVAAAALYATPALAERMRDVNLREPLAAGATLEIDDVNGSIIATRAPGDAVTVHGHASTDGSDPGPVVRTSRKGSRLIVCAVFPGDDDSGGCPQSHNAGNNDHLRIDLTVGVPHGVGVVARNVNGPISTTGLDAPADVSDVSGAITIATSSTANASNVNGAIQARFSGRGDARFNAVNGPINLIVPRDADATFRAETLNGPISASGADLSTHSGQFVGHSATATLGAGHGRISVHTVNGSIHLERR